MSKQDVIGFSGAGLLTWLVASAFYAAFGASLLEMAFWFYALNAFLATGFAAVAFKSVVRLRHTPSRERLVPALLFIAPGLLAGAVALAVGRPLLLDAPEPNFARYALFLVACYGAVVADAVESCFEREPARATA